MGLSALKRIPDPNPCRCVLRVGVRGALDVFGVGSGVWQEGATLLDTHPSAILSDPSILGRGTCPSECSPGPRLLAGIFEASALGMEERAALVGRILLPLILTGFVL